VAAAGKGPRGRVRPPAQRERDAGGSRSGRRAQARSRRFRRVTAEALAVAFVLALFIRTFIVQAFKIPSDRCCRRCKSADHILVNKFRYGIRLPLHRRAAS